MQTHGHERWLGGGAAHGGEETAAAAAATLAKTQATRRQDVLLGLASVEGVRHVTFFFFFFFMLLGTLDILTC
jgi:hypothetical protein